jgi:hypothetical protein
MADSPKLNEKQVQAMLKLSLLQAQEKLARIKEIEAMPDDGSVDKLALLAAVLNPTGVG